MFARKGYQPLDEPSPMKFRSYGIRRIRNSAKICTNGLSNFVHFCFRTWNFRKGVHRCSSSSMNRYVQFLLINIYFQFNYYLFSSLFKFEFEIHVMIQIIDINYKNGRRMEGMISFPSPESISNFSFEKRI